MSGYKPGPGQRRSERPDARDRRHTPALGLFPDSGRAPPVPAAAPPAPRAPLPGPRRPGRPRLASRRPWLQPQDTVRSPPGPRAPRPAGHAPPAEGYWRRYAPRAPACTARWPAGTGSTATTSASRPSPAPCRAPRSSHPRPAPSRLRRAQAERRRGAVAGRDPPSPTVAADWPHRARPGPELRPPEMEALRGGGRAGSAPERAKGGADVQRRGFRARRPLAAGRGERTLSSLSPPPSRRVYGAGSQFWSRFQWPWGCPYSCTKQSLQIPGEARFT